MITIRCSCAIVCQKIWHKFKPFYSKKRIDIVTYFNCQNVSLKVPTSDSLTERKKLLTIDMIVCIAKNRSFSFLHSFLAHSFLTSVECAYWDFFLHHGTPKAEIKFKFYCRHEKKNQCCITKIKRAKENPKVIRVFQK